MHPLSHFLIDRLKRSLLASAGLLLSTFGVYLQLAANIGLSPWTALNQGLSNHLPITFGQASIMVSVIIVALDLLMHETIGLGTILDALLVGWGSDLFIALELVPYQTKFLPGLAILVIGLVIACVGQWLYMLAGLSCGPRDAFLVGLGKKLPKLPIGRVNIILNLVVALVAFLLGGQIGLGTIIALLGTGIIMDIVFKIIRFEPRSVTHEGLVETIREFLKAAKARPPHFSHKESSDIMELKIKALSPKIGTEIPAPFYATPGAAAMDLHACIDKAVIIPAGGRKVIPTGIAIALPDAGYVALVFARSGLGIKHGIAPANCVGVIDSDYRGEIMVGLQNSGDTDYTVQPADRIAQLMITPVVQATVSMVEELDDTARGTGGFGSTGK